MPSIIFSELLETSAEAGSDDRTNRLIKHQESPRSSAMPPGTFHISLRWAKIARIPPPPNFSKMRECEMVCPIRWRESYVCEAGNVNEGSGLTEGAGKSVPSHLGETRGQRLGNRGRGTERNWGQLGIPRLPSKSTSLEALFMLRCDRSPVMLTWLQKLRLQKLRNFSA
jgi:hypothetical protein